ncbi:MAG: DUF4364 family protein [Clostridia bacterium]|nr:DUF4364 family protein [Clostridia bacterium]
MEKDAVSAGVSQAGGLFSTAQIRILICYLLAAINKPVPGRLLADTLHYEGIANCFEVNDSIASLCKGGQLRLHDQKDDTYVITDSGRSIAQTLKTSLPLAVKDRAYSAAIKMVSRFKNAKETDIKISREGEKAYITCSAIDNGVPLISVKLMIADEEQGLYIKEKFLDNTSEIYSKIIELLTK